MANEVYANGREISCKAGAGKSTCAFPDVCFTPPQTPATPPGVPIPYPNTGMDSDTTDGSKTVVISGKEVMLKNKSYFKKSTGDEAGCAPKKGVVTSVNRGKVYFNAWSMDVKIEGENAVRHLDITTHNHACFPGNSPTWPFLDAQAFAGSGDCKDLAKDLKTNCAGKVQMKGGKVHREDSMKAMCDHPPCRETLKCVLTKKDPNNCCSDENGKQPTPHHIVPASQFHEKGRKDKPLLTHTVNGVTENKYSYNGAPCICAQGTTHTGGKHGDLHTETNNLTVNHPTVRPHVTGKTIAPDARWKVSDAEAVGAKAVHETTGCDEKCTKAQVRKGHDDMGIKEGDNIRPATAGTVTEPPENDFVS